MKNFTQDKQGTLYAILAFSFWGLVPIYFKSVSHVSAFEVLVHRILWSVIFLLMIILITKTTSNVLIVMRNKKKLKLLFLSAILVSLNWLTFIWAISNNKIVEASLGYYINPLVNVILGYLFFKERVNKSRVFAIFLAFIAILYQLYTLGELPVISIILALSFGFYGLVRKKIHVESISGLFIETLLISPFALLYFIYLQANEMSAFTFSLDKTTILLILAGFITIIPLIWFNSAATRISMIKLGFLQYIGPSLSFLLAIFLYHEPFNKDKLVTFIIIWVALAIFSIPKKK
ncbi:EamA family transporter RarD [Sulfurospirillum sp. 1307]